MANRFDKDIERFQKMVDKARAEMGSACEHYATAMATLAVARERQERADSRRERPI